MGLSRRTPAGGGTGGDATVTPISINNALGLADSSQMDQIKTYLKISGFDASCYDLVAIRNFPEDPNNKILDGGLDV
jgi:hypothetical protein